MFGHRNYLIINDSVGPIIIHQRNDLCADLEQRKTPPFLVRSPEQ
jgi:hypothetical protein